MSHQTTIARPWIYSKIMQRTDNPVYAYMIGTQFFSSVKIAQARTYFEADCRKNPDSVEFAMNLARIYMIMENSKRAEDILLSFFGKAEPPKYKVFLFWGDPIRAQGGWTRLSRPSTWPRITKE
ncbi:MAG: hypothetical protein WBC70_08525 [Candidatus Aminicenantales bacterium]